MSISYADHIVPHETRDVGVGQLISGSWKSLLDAKRQLLAPWLALTVVQLAMQLGAKFLGMEPAALVKTGPGFIFTLAVAIATSVISAGVVRSLLGRKEDAWDLDAGALGYVGFNVAMLVLLRLCMLGLTPPAGQSPAEMAAYGVRALGILVGFLALAWAGVRCALWPVAILMRNGELTLGRAWSLMKGGFWTYVIASFVLSLVPSFIAGFFTGLGKATHLPLMPLSVAFTSLTALSMAALLAQLYRAKVGDDGQYEEVFG